MNIAWPATGAVAWITGATVLQTRARNHPLDLRLNLAVLALTTVAFHLVAYTSIVAKTQVLNLAAVPMFDVVVIIGAWIAVKRRTQLTERSFWMVFLILIGSLTFWIWFIAAIGGLFPK